MNTGRERGGISLRFLWNEVSPSEWCIEVHWWVGGVVSRDHEAKNRIPSDWAVMSGVDLLGASTRNNQPLGRRFPLGKVLSPLG